LWTCHLHRLFPINILGAKLSKLPQSREGSPKAADMQLTTPLSSAADFQNHAVSAIKEVRVDMADMKVEARPVVLVTTVGSCVAICIHDRANRCGGLAHIMLPNSSVKRSKSFPYKYADTAVPAMIEALQKRGKRSCCLTAKIAGGANMFPDLRSDALNIGLKNVEAVKKALAAKGVRLLAEDVRGTCGRKVVFNVVNGSVHVQKGNGEVKRI
jgi:chemotaxis protein CheD